MSSGLRYWFVSTTLVGSAIREEPVDYHAANGEQEDEQTPQDLAQNWAVGLQDLNCEVNSQPHSHVVIPQEKKTWILDHIETGRGCMVAKRTEDNDIENEDDKTHNPAASAIAPCVAVGFDRDRSRHGEGEHRELNEHLQCDLKHDC
jgi:hypothetical protein